MSRKNLCMLGLLLYVLVAVNMPYVAAQGVHELVAEPQTAGLLGGYLPWIWVSQLTKLQAFVELTNVGPNPFPGGNLTIQVSGVGVGESWMEKDYEIPELQQNQSWTSPRYIIQPTADGTYRVSYSFQAADGEPVETYWFQKGEPWGESMSVQVFPGALDIAAISALIAAISVAILVWRWWRGRD